MRSVEIQGHYGHDTVSTRYESRATMAMTPYRHIYKHTTIRIAPSVIVTQTEGEPNLLYGHYDTH